MPDEGKRYKALSGGVIRTGKEMESPKAKPDKLTEGQEILVTETADVNGTLRLKFEGGWTSLTAKSGKVLMEKLDPDTESDNDDDSEPEDSDLESNASTPSVTPRVVDAATTVKYKALAAGLVRAGSVMDSDKTDFNGDGKLKEGEVIVVTSTEDVGGTMRLEFEGGWTSLTTKSGKVLMEKMEEEESAPILRHISEHDMAALEDELAALADSGELEDVKANDADDAKESKPARYKALGPGAIRSGAAMDSESAGKLTEGEIIEVSETKELENGTIHVHFDRGWTSITAKSGKALLELMVDEDEDKDGEEEAAVAKAKAEEEEATAAKAKQEEEANKKAEKDAAEKEAAAKAAAAAAAEENPAGVEYKIVSSGVIRTGKAMDTDKAKPEKTVEGEVILVTETGELKDGIVRLKFEGGWTSLTAKSGKLLIEKVEEQAEPAAEEEPAVDEEPSRGESPDLLERELNAIEDEIEAGKPDIKVREASDTAEEDDESTNGSIEVRFFYRFMLFLKSFCAVFMLFSYRFMLFLY